MVTLTTADTMLSHAELQGVPLLVLANKMDLEVRSVGRSAVCVARSFMRTVRVTPSDATQDARSVNAIAQVLDIEAYQGAVAAHPICALTQDGIADAVNWLIDAVKSSDRYYAKTSGGGS